jgi:hypothetical protein
MSYLSIMPIVTVLTPLRNTNRPKDLRSLYVARQIFSFSFISSAAFDLPVNTRGLAMLDPSRLLTFDMVLEVTAGRARHCICSNTYEPRMFLFAGSKLSIASNKVLLDTTPQAL